MRRMCMRPFGCTSWGGAGPEHHDPSYSAGDETLGRRNLPGGADVGPDRIDDLLERQPPSWRVVRSLWLVVILGGIGLFS